MSKLVNIWDLYGADDRMVIDTMTMTITAPLRWRTDITYPGVRFLLFTKVNSGIQCWKDFNDFLHQSFPDLQSLFLRQDYSKSVTCKKAEEKEHFMEFLQDPWLKHIWIDDRRTWNMFDRRELPKDCFRMFHNETDCGLCDGRGSKCNIKHQWDDVIDGTWSKNEIINGAVLTLDDTHTCWGGYEVNQVPFVNQIRE